MNQLQNMKFRIQNQSEQDEIFKNLIRIGCLRPDVCGKEPFNEFVPFIIVMGSVIYFTRQEEVYEDQDEPETTLEELKLM